mgnify:CR=1 FL=1
MQSEKNANSLLGRNQKILYENKIWFLLYYPDQEVASRFNKTTDKKRTGMGFPTKESRTDEKTDFSEPAKTDRR